MALHRRDDMHNEFFAGAVFCLQKLGEESFFSGMRSELLDVRVLGNHPSKFYLAVEGNKHTDRRTYIFSCRPIVRFSFACVRKRK